MLLRVSNANLAKLNKNNYRNVYNNRGGMLLNVSPSKEGIVMGKLGLLSRPGNRQNFKQMTKYRGTNFVALKQGKRFVYVLNVRPNGSTYLVNVNPPHTVRKVNLAKVFTNKQRRNTKLNQYIKNTLERIQVKKVNFKNKTDPVSLHNFKPKERAIRVKTGPTYQYYQPSTIQKLAGGERINFTRVRPNQPLFQNPLTRQNVYGRNVSKVRMVKSHKVKRS